MELEFEVIVHDNDKINVPSIDEQNYAEQLTFTGDNVGNSKSNINCYVLNASDNLEMFIDADNTYLNIYSYSSRWMLNQ